MMEVTDDRAMEASSGNEPGRRSARVIGRATQIRTKDGCGGKIADRPMAGRLIGLCRPPQRLEPNGNQAPLCGLRGALAADFIHLFFLTATLRAFAGSRFRLRSSCVGFPKEQVAPWLAMGLAMGRG
jgi:hypothetical protein